MASKVNTDWLINNGNIFGLKDSFTTYSSALQFQIILEADKREKLDSISDYLGLEIYFKNEGEIILSQDKIAFEAMTMFLNRHPSLSYRSPVSLILIGIQGKLLDEYYKRTHKNILAFEDYKKNYEKFLNDFLASNIDTDEFDFIEEEKGLCDKLIEELAKPIYDEISILNYIDNKPSTFKKHLSNSLDKRKKFLVRKEFGIKAKSLSSNKKFDISWIGLFDLLDTEFKSETRVYLTNSFIQKEVYFSEASIDLALQLLIDFKKETIHLSSKRKLDYITSLDLKRPKPSETENPLFNQTVFEAKSIFFDVITAYKEELHKATSIGNLPILNKTTYSTKHYVLAYIIECYAMGVQIPSGNKKEIEKIGEKRLENGSGNTFYKSFNKISNQDLNSLSTLIEIAGNDWRSTILELSQHPIEVEQYLSSKQL